MMSPTAIDMEKVCRVCMETNLELFLIFDEKYAVERTSLAEILTLCTIYKVQRHDELPHQICASCIEWAKAAFSFKRKCEQSYRVLIDMLDKEGINRKTDSLIEFKKETESYVEKSTQTEDSTMYPCERCEKKFFNFDALREHRENDHKGCAIVCRFCSKTFNRVGYLRSHIAIFHPESGYTSPNQCNICNRQFTRRHHMLRHLALIHKIVEISNTIDLGKEAEEDNDSLKSDTLELTEDIKFISEDGDIKLHSNLSFEDPKSIQSDGDDKMEDVQKEMRSSDEEDEKPLSELANISRRNFAEVLIDEQHPIVDQMSGFEELISNNIKIEISAVSSADYLDVNSDNDGDHVKKFITPSPTNEESGTEIEVKDKKCMQCNKNFRSQKFLKRHIRQHHAEREKRKKTLECEECNLIFSHIAEFKRHNEAKHTAKIHQCEICQKSFTTKMYMQRHMASHGKKRFMCKECSEGFQTRDELSTHIKVEGHDKPLLCPECGLRCKTSNILMVHMRRHKGEKPFKCKFCSKGFPRMDDLRIHEKYHTGEKSHFCETCGKGFQRKYNLTIHMRVHTGEKPYKCPHCPHAFTQSNDLKSHIRRHTGERFRCEICSAPFLQGYQMRQHKLLEHGVKEDPPTQRVEKYTSPEEQEQQIKQNLQRELAKANDTNKELEPLQHALISISKNIDDPDGATTQSDISFLNI